MNMDVSAASQGVDVVLESLSAANSPQCEHGPTIQFERFAFGSMKRFYACSACRDRRHCNFFQWADQLLSKKKAKERHKLMKQLQKAPFSQQEYKKRLSEIRQLPQQKRHFCQQCGVLLLPPEVKGHEGHVIMSDLSKPQLRHPTNLLAPLDNKKTNAQYLFSSETLSFLLDTIETLGFSKVLCVGVPRIHEAICARQAQKETKIRSLLLDIDQRLEQFYPKHCYCRYNMFNHYFFRGMKSEAVYKDFLIDGATCSGIHGNILVIIDPPFGGLVDVLAHTVKRISSDWQQANPGSDKTLPFMWIFPYFMESRITQSLPSFTMLDFKVNYDNHTVFCGDKKSSKHGSPVRIYTNITPGSVILPSPQYRFCKKCVRYVSAENKHCMDCKACTSKDGRQYKHCPLCERCVKPTWSHCDRCNTCHLPEYKCQTPNLGCHICGDHSHKRRECPQKYNKQLRRKRKEESQVCKVKPKKMKKQQC